jgi:glycosyltransferase involved in cell wall biosynthesis
MVKRLVSVIIPIYNDHRFLLEAIESVRQQSYRHYEIIVVDDGSVNSDEIVNAISPHGDEVRYFRNKKNVGLAASRNAGMRLAQGEYLCFLDADDLFAPDKLKHQVAEIESDPDLMMVFSEEYILGMAHEHTPFYSIVKKGHEPILELHVQKNFIAVFTVMMRSEIVGRVGYFDEKLKAWEDNDYWLRVMLEGKVKFSEYVSGYRRLHDANMSKDKQKMDFYSLIAFHQWIVLCKKKNRATLAAIVKERAMSHVKVYLYRGLKTFQFNIRACWYIFLIIFLD